ncbi:MAG: rhodanese-like domain-containing protein [Bacteroidota bacterium]|nr:rhodanese-like domain-containing protein [Bacteroidota bacterium]
MYVQQIYTSCLSESAYFVESGGEAILIDPLRDIEPYMDLAKKHHATIKYIFETHIHADFVSGHLDLSKTTGAPIIFGPNAEVKFPFHLAKDGEIFKIGGITLEVIHTPGHTLESTCYLLRNEAGKPYCIFTGDTLFVGDVGRPDLSSGNRSQEELASLMYDSLQNKIMPLDDDIIVYPAHGRGTSCGKNLGSETSTTIGEQKKNNYALSAQSREQFIASLTDGLDAAPPYFSLNAKINKEGYSNLDDVKRKGLTPLSVKEFKMKMAEGFIALDTRAGAHFVNGFVPGSLFIGLEGRFAEWAGSLLPFNGNIILITEPGKEEQTIVRLARVGFDNVEGYLNGSFNAWEEAGEAIDIIIDIEPDELAMDIPYDENLLILDVRKENEFAEGHVKDALNLPLGDMIDIAQIAGLEESKNIYVHCGGGYRSLIASSILKSHGYHNIRNITGGWKKIKEEKNIVTEKEGSVLN